MVLRRLMVIEQRRWRWWRRRRWRLLWLVRGRLRGRGRVRRRRSTAAAAADHYAAGAAADRGHRSGYAAVMVMMVVVAGRLLAGLVVQYGHADQTLGGVRHVGRLDLGRHLTLPLVPPVLEPDLHLGLGQVQGRGQPGSLRAGQVPLDVERGLELEHLAPGEHRPGLLLSLSARPAASAASAAAAATAVVLFTGVLVVGTVVHHVVVVVHGNGRVHRLVHVTAAAGSAAVVHEPSLVVR